MLVNPPPAKSSSSTNSNAKQIQLEIPADYQYLSVIGTIIQDILQRLEVTDLEAESYNIQLAVHETCTNIIQHAYEGLVDQTIALRFGIENDPPSLMVELWDTGKIFELPKIRIPNQDGPQENGMGLFLMHELMDQVEYLPTASYNHWKLMKKLAR